MLDDLNETLMGGSQAGKRLQNIKRQSIFSLSFHGKSYPITKEITIGRSDSCDLLMDDNLVSKRHALIQKIKDEYLIRDLNSKNGTYVNNQRISTEKYVRLKKGDIVKIGRTEMAIV